jgi:hypothetical protein
VAFLAATFFFVALAVAFFFVALAVAFFLVAFTFTTFIGSVETPELFTFVSCGAIGTCGTSTAKAAGAAKPEIKSALIAILFSECFFIYSHFFYSILTLNLKMMREYLRFFKYEIPFPPVRCAIHSRFNGRLSPWLMRADIFQRFRSLNHTAPNFHL